VLAIASKQLVDCDFKKVTREEAERGLSFNGFEVFENKLKPETKAAIGELKEAAIGTVMITGDNPLTGSNIGYKCGISHREKGMLIIDFKN
jgi:cation-transporting ATPase 13A2